MASSLVTITIFALFAAGLCQEDASSSSRPSMADYRASKAAAAQTAQDAADKQAKMGAVDKVLSLLQDLQSKVVKEGEAEAITYAAVCRQCDVIKEAKSQDIQTEQSDVTREDAEIVEDTADETGLERDMTEIEADLKQLAEDKDAAQIISDRAKAVYITNHKDMLSGVTSLEEAIKELKAGKTSLLQVEAVSQTVADALLLADALGLGSAQKAAKTFKQALLQSDSDSNGAPEVEMENYKFKSTDIADTLETLLKQFKTEKNKLDKDEVARVKVFKELMQTKSDDEKAFLHEMTAIKKPKMGQKVQEIGVETVQMNIDSAQLNEDRAFLDVTVESCKQKEATFDQRKSTRASEITALSTAIGIIKTTVTEKTGKNTARLAQTGVSIHFADAVAHSESAMEAIEAEAEFADESSVPAFVQTSSSLNRHFLQRVVKVHNPDLARDMVISLFKGKGQQLHSATLMSMAATLSADPLAKVKELVAQLVERLLTEAANEANQKGWCDKSQGDAEQKRQYAADEVAALTAKTDEQQALSDSLEEELASLSDQIVELGKVGVEAQEERRTEKAENENTVSDSRAGIAAVNTATQTLSRFYATAKNQADAVQGEEGDDSDSGKVQNTYSGSSAAAGGIIAMMDVIASDFKRSISKSTSNEAQAQEIFLKFMTTSMSSIEEKKVAQVEKGKLKGDTDTNLADDKEILEGKEGIVKTAAAELDELKNACQIKGQTPAEKAEQRQEEISSLKKGICIVNSLSDGGSAMEC